MSEDSRTIWCGNLSDKVTEEILYELFLQVAPLERVRIPTDKNGRKSNFGFVTVKHEQSVDYVVQLLEGTCLYDRQLNIKPRNVNRGGNNQQNVPIQPPVVQSNMINIDQLLFMGQQLMFTPPTQLNDGGGGIRRDDDRYNDRNNRHNARGRNNKYDDGYDANKEKWNNNYRNDRNNRGGGAHHARDRNRNRHSRFY